MRLHIEKVNRRARAKARGSMIAKGRVSGKRHIHSVYDAKTNTVRVYHATKGWRVRNADRLPVAW